MTNQFGIDFVKNAMDNAISLKDLERIWGGIAYAYQRHPEIVAHKNKRKAELS